MAYTHTIVPDDPASISAALRTEWLLTNGLGGYAMGTLLGVNTRRYHGLFIVAARPPVGRIVALHSMVERFTLADQSLDLATQQFVGGDGRLMLHPPGYRWLTEVTLEPPHRITWTYRVSKVSLRKRLTLEWGVHRARVEYEIENTPGGVLASIRPFTPLRDFHALDQQQSGAQPQATVSADAVVLARAGVRIALRGRALSNDALWWQGFAYELDRERGQDWREDVWSPGSCSGEVALHVAASASITCELLDVPAPPAAAAGDSSTPMMAANLSETARPLIAATRAFTVNRRMGEVATWMGSVIAGYPWFGDWGRDAMISLLGLLLTTGRVEDARSTLETFAANLRNGLVPNLFDDYGGAAHYNTVDASLWFVHAVHALAQADAGLKSAGQKLIDACRAIVDAYRSGTDFHIRMDADGLIAAGDATTQLTWMDAARDGVVFTPRFGKAVEINALWHNALVCLSELTGDAAERSDLLMLARQVAASFRSAFWWDQRQCLHDCLVPGDGASVADGAQRFIADGKLRPNQIFAASLPFSPLNDVQRREVVKIVGERLLTPFGLRTLDREDAGYKPRYEGSMFERDAAYHNGTVWPWLIGPYCEALLRVENFGEDAKQRVKQILQPLLDEMRSTAGGRCLGQIAEVYDGEPPHRPSGCPAQAWSVAEVLRALLLVG